MDTKDIRFLRDGVARHVSKSESHVRLRDKQVEAFRALVSDKFSDEQISHSYFKLPTGFGKTVMFSTMVHAYFDAAGAKKQKIIIVVPRLSLINQTKGKLDRFADIVATEYSGRMKDNKSDVIITTYNSLNKLFNVIDFNKVGLVFADEAHHILGDKISKILTLCNEYVPIIGFTATPEYESNRAVADMLNTEIFAMTIPDSIKSGILSPVKNVLYRSSIVCDLSTVPAKTNGEYDYDAITTKISPNTLATEIAHIYADGVDDDTGIEFRNLKAIINCPNAKIADIQAAKINEVMGRNVAISLHKVGISNKQFDKLQNDFIDGKYNVACQVGTMTEGFDDVTVSMCINYPTRSRVKAEQTAGRAIRIDENNPDKIAFVVDTIFRNTPTEQREDILYTASNSHQILFKDIAGDMVLYPKDFMPKKRDENAGRRDQKNVEFVDYELITDSAILVELNKNTNERIASETYPQKTAEWLSVEDLRKDKDFPCGSPTKIDKVLKDFEHKPGFEGFILDMKSFAVVVKCIHVSKKQLLAERAGFIAYPQKTAEWLSANDLKKDPDFPCGGSTKINDALKIFEHKPEFEGFILDMKSSGMVAKCIHVSKKQLLAERAGFIACPPKTSEWLSCVDLKRDKDFPCGTTSTINNALKDFEHKPEFEGFIVRMKSGAHTALCIHVSKKQLLAQKAFVPPKTSEWLSAQDLKRDKGFPCGTTSTINNALKDSEHKPEFEGFIRDMQCGSKIARCIHVSKKQLFAERAGFIAYPQKTDEWLSAEDLKKDTDFPYGDAKKINTVFDDLEHEPEFEGFIRYMKCRSVATKCIHVSKKQLLAQKAFVPKKTSEWLSAEDLRKDKDFPCGSSIKIGKVLKDFEHEPEFEGFIRDMLCSTRVAICIHVSKKQLLATKMKQKSVQRGTKVVATLDDFQNATTTPTPDNQHEK